MAHCPQVPRAEKVRFYEVYITIDRFMWECRHVPTSNLRCLSRNIRSKTENKIHATSGAKWGDTNDLKIKARKGN